MNVNFNGKLIEAMRWYALDVDFEMYGKDLIESAILSTNYQIIRKTNPSGFAYELFLDERGEKISKSKGNGITIEEWLDYASPDKVYHYLCIKIQKDKKLYKVVQKAVDDYIEFIQKAENKE